MKKIGIVVVLVALLAFSLVFSTACKPGEDIRIVMPDGAPALAAAQLLKENPAYKNRKVTYEIVAGATEVTAKILQGEADLAIMPTNLAAIQYNGGAVQFLASVTHGLLYLIGTENAASLEDLKGKLVYNIGRGAPPDLTFKYILQQKGIGYNESATTDPDKVALKYVSEGSELIPLLKSGAAKFGILGEPAVTQAVANTGAQIKFSMQDLWAEVNAGNASYPMACLVGRKAFLDAGNDKFVEWFLEKLTDSAAWILENPADAGDALKAAGSKLTVTFTKAVVESCNIQIVGAAAAKTAVNAYLGVLHGFNAQAVGGKLPDDAFYYAL